MSRPEPPYLAPDGYRWEAAPKDGWDLDKADGRRCRAGAGYRHSACGRPAVAALQRSLPNNWWAYCADHLYGGWIEDGRVMCWRLREVTR